MAVWDTVIPMVLPSLLVLYCVQEKDTHAHTQTKNISEFRTVASRQLTVNFNCDLISEYDDNDDMQKSEQ